jgi:DNA-binding Xre family transcriptional regulator
MVIQTIGSSPKPPVKRVIRQVRRRRQRRLAEVLEIEVHTTSMIKRHLDENIGFLTLELCRAIRTELPKYIRKVSGLDGTESLRATIQI